MGQGISQKKLIGEEATINFKHYIIFKLSSIYTFYKQIMSK